MTSGEKLAAIQRLIPEQELEAATDRAIQVCGGDARAAVRALLVANAALEDQLALTVPVVSRGFSRGWHSRKASD